MPKVTQLVNGGAEVHKLLGRHSRGSRFYLGPLRSEWKFPMQTCGGRSGTKVQKGITHRKQEFWNGWKWTWNGS